jgi:HAD superfamily hydrolase (TIGR01509 family)
MTVKAVVFDVSGVLVEPPAGVVAPETFGPDQDSDHPWHKLERGELTLTQVMRLLPPPAEGRRSLPPPYKLYGEVIEVAEQLHAAGFRLALCTNAVRELTMLWWGLYAWQDLFDVIVRSHEIGARKPSPEPYLAVLAELGTRPEETLFVDDMQANRATARRLGMVALPPNPARIRAATGLDTASPRARIGPPGLRRPIPRDEADELLISVLFDSQLRADPYARLARLRELDPVHRLADRPIAYLTRYEDCRTVLTDRAFVKVAGDLPTLDFVTGIPVVPAPPGSFVPAAFVDPPVHDAARGVLATGFRPARLRELEPAVRSAAADLVAGLVEAGTADLVGTVSFPMAIRVICDLLAVPEADRPKFRRLVREASLSFEPGISLPQRRTALNAIFAMTDYFRDAEPHGLLAALLAEGERAGVHREQVIADVVFLFAAGFETVAHLISATFFLLTANPEQYDQVRADPGLAGAAVGEAGRLQSPVQTDSRMVGTATTMGGVELNVGEVAVTLLGAANRDPACFPDPDVFDLHRTGPPPLTFGLGPHYCLGARLAALEATAVLEALVAAGVERIETGGFTWKDAMVLRGFDALEITCR